MWTISLPLRVPISKKKYFPLNLNQYRNAHYHTLDKAKKNFHELVKGLLRGVPKLERCALEYTLYPGTRQLCDVNNVCSIADKFFSDSLVHLGILEDDNYNFIADSRFRFGCIDKENPRVDVVIRSPDHIPLVPPEPLTERAEPNMKILTVITLTTEDVNAALRVYLSKQINIAEDSELHLDVTDDGNYELRLEQGELTTHETPSTPEKAAKGGRGAKKARLDPKTAMASLREKETKEDLPFEANVKPEEGNDDAGEEEASEPVQEATETALEAKPKTLFVKPQDVNPDNLTAEAHIAPKVEETPPPAKPKGPSLFSNFKRPSNG